ncbi:hypothetical protein MSG37_00930 [Shewanella sp. 1CM18E]|uniref:hypothetical protein n=1 Tax=Shewanella sp. 1CM18E TaxID=2929169 RepID=UPI0020BE1363|nr:hypothetical protein [Shewanella sp. 1CM18E]MCK8043436.1 hypothetical protein [Shewanella sp. 1CM18E]
MSADVPVAVIGAVAVVTASIIGLIVAVATATIAKEQKISEFRQAWINEFKIDIALALKHAFTSSFHKSQAIKQKLDLDKANEHIELSNDAFAEFELKVILIKLKLNPEKDKRFISTLNSALELVGKSVNHEKKYTTHFKDVSKIYKLIESESHSILKSEWERVKLGERRYRNFKYLGKFCIGAFIVAFYVLLILVKFPSYFPGVEVIALTADSLRSVM